MWGDMNLEEYLFFEKRMKELLALPKIQKLNRYIQHGDVTCLEHSVYVAYSSYYLCRYFKLKVDYDSLIRGALLHDYFLYDWHEKSDTHRLHGFHHPFTAYRNAARVFKLNRIERDIIRNHMWPLTILHIPKTREGIAVCIADKLCSAMETIHRPVFIPGFMN